MYQGPQLPTRAHHARQGIPTERGIPVRPPTTGLTGKRVCRHVHTVTRCGPLMPPCAARTTPLDPATPRPGKRAPMRQVLPGTHSPVCASQSQTRSTSATERSAAPSYGMSRPLQPCRGGPGVMRSTRQPHVGPRTCLAVCDVRAEAYMVARVDLWRSACLVRKAATDDKTTATGSHARRDMY